MIRSIIVLFYVIIFAFNLTAQEEEVNSKLILGGSIFGNKNTTTRNLGTAFTADELIIETKSTEIGLLPYILFGKSPKRKFGLGISTVFRTSNNTSNQTNVEVGSRDSELDLGLDLLYRHFLYDKNHLKLFTQLNVGGVTTAFLTNDQQSAFENNIFFIQSEIEFGGSYRIVNSWNLLLSIPIMEYRFQESSFDNSSPPVISTRNNSSNTFRLNTSFTNLNLGVEKLF